MSKATKDELLRRCWSRKIKATAGMTKKELLEKEEEGAFELTGKDLKLYRGWGRPGGREKVHYNSKLEAIDLFLSNTAAKHPASRPRATQKERKKPQEQEEEDEEHTPRARKEPQEEEEEDEEHTRKRQEDDEEDEEHLTPAKRRRLAEEEDEEHTRKRQEDDEEGEEHLTPAKRRRLAEEEDEDDTGEEGDDQRFAAEQRRQSAEELFPLLSKPQVGSKTGSKERKRAIHTLTCSPSHATLESLVYQNPLVMFLDGVPGDDKMMAEHNMAQEKVLNFIIPRLLRNRVDSRLCFSDAGGELEDRITTGSLFSGLRYFCPREVDINTRCISTEDEVKVMVEERDDKGRQVLNEFGDVKLVPRLVSPAKYFAHETHERHQASQAADFVTFTRSPDREELYLSERSLKCFKDDLEVPTSIFEAKLAPTMKGVWQTAMSAIRLILDRAERERLIDRLHCFTGGMSTYMYSVLNAFGFVRVTNHVIDHESYMNFVAYQELCRRVLQEAFPTESWQRYNCPDEQSLQVRYNQARASFRYQFGSSVVFPSETTSYLVAVFYSNSPEIKTLPTGTGEIHISSVQNFVQGFMRIHVGNRFLGWTLQQAKATYKARSAEVSENLRVSLAGKRLFDFPLEITYEQLQMFSGNGVWKLTEFDDLYVLRLPLSKWAGNVRVIETTSIFGGEIKQEIVMRVVHQQHPYPVFFFFPSDANPDMFEVWYDEKLLTIGLQKRPGAKNPRVHYPVRITKASIDIASAVSKVREMTTK